MTHHTPKMLSRVFFTCALSGPLLVYSLAAQTLFQDDFEGGFTGWQNTRNTSVVSDSPELFGSSNDYADLTDNFTGNYVQLASGNQSGANGTLTTFSFDFYEPSSSGSDSIGAGYRAGSDLNTGGARLRVFLDDGSLSGTNDTGTTSFGSVYNLDTAYNLTVVFNDSASLVNYANRTLASGSYDVWIRTLGATTDSYVGTGAANSTISQANYAMAFRTFNTQTQALYIDNVSLESGASVAVPEAKMLGLLLLSSPPLLLVRRRCARHFQ